MQRRTEVCRGDRHATPINHSVSAPDEAVWALYDIISHMAIKFEISAYDNGTYEVRWTDF